MQTLKTPPWGYRFFIYSPAPQPAACHRATRSGAAAWRTRCRSRRARRGGAYRAPTHRRRRSRSRRSWPRREKRLVNRDLSQAVGPSQVLHGVPRPGRSAESGFNPECQVWEIRDLSKDLTHGSSYASPHRNRSIAPMGGAKAHITWPRYVIANGSKSSHYPSRPNCLAWAPLSGRNPSR